MRKTWIRRLHFLLTWRQRRRELEEEMRLHRELRARQILRDDAASRETAVAMASCLFGNETLLKERADDMWGWTWLDDLSRDLRQSGRMLAANPAFAAIAILTLGLGIGANTAIFSVSDALLRRGMPVEAPEELYRVHTDRMPWNASNTGDSTTSFSHYVFEHLRTEQQVLSALVAYVPMGFNKIPVRVGAMPEEASANMVSGNFFSGLGVRPACGRVFSNDDEATHAPVAEVSYGYASKEFGSACSAVGHTIHVRGVPFTIVGVTADSFRGVEGQPTDVWVPLQARPDLNAWGSSNKNYRADTSWWCILMMARVKPGVSPSSAEARLNPLFYRAAYDPLGGKPAKGEKPVRLGLVPAQGIAGADSFKKPLQVLQVMVGLLLVIACSNVSMLLSVRNAAREREFCIRLALGGSRARLIRQLLAESLVLMFCGALLGLMLAVGATRVLGIWAELEIPQTPDRAVLLFTLTVSVVAAIAFGIGPAISATRTSIADSIKNSAATAHRNRSKIATGNLLTAAQLALCLVLLVGTGLLVRTLQNLKNINVGFAPGGLLVFGINPPAQLQGDHVATFYNDLVAKLRTVPRVKSVTLMGNRIGSGWSNNSTAIVDGAEPKALADTTLRWNDVGADFFTTLGIRIASGRDFNDQDSAKSAFAAIVNRTFVQRFLQGRNALGHTVHANGKPFAIIGVVEDSKYSELAEKAIPMAWFPYSQVGDFGAMHMELRTVGPAMSILPAVRSIVAGFGPDLALLQPRTQQAEFERTISNQNLLAKLSVAFAVLALVLVTIGLYGTISYGVKRRTMEVGIRVALGAERGGVIWMILKSGILLCSIGLALGIPLALATGHLIASLLYGVSPTDITSIAMAAISLLIVGLIATYVPARRAASIDAIKALRYE